MNGDDSISWKTLALVGLLALLVTGIFAVNWTQTTRKQNVDPLLGGQRGDYRAPPPPAPNTQTPSTPGVPVPPAPPPPPASP